MVQRPCHWAPPARRLKAILQHLTPLPFLGQRRGGVLASGHFPVPRPWVDSVVSICGQPLKSCFIHIDLFMSSGSAQIFGIFLWSSIAQYPSIRPLKPGFVVCLTNTVCSNVPKFHQVGVELNACLVRGRWVKPAGQSVVIHWNHSIVWPMVYDHWKTIETDGGTTRKPLMSMVKMPENIQCWWFPQNPLKVSMVFSKPFKLTMASSNSL